MAVYQPASAQPVPVHGSFQLPVQKLFLLAELPKVSVGTLHVSPGLSEFKFYKMSALLSNLVLPAKQCASQQ